MGLLINTYIHVAVQVTEYYSYWLQMGLLINTYIHVAVQVTEYYRYWLQVGLLIAAVTTLLAIECYSYWLIPTSQYPSENLLLAI